MCDLGIKQYLDGLEFLKCIIHYFSLKVDLIIVNSSDPNKMR